jgi:hypothetical protein
MSIQGYFVKRTILAEKQQQLSETHCSAQGSGTWKGRGVR